MTRPIEIKVINESTAEILIYDVVGAGYEDGVTAKGFAKELKAAGNVENIDIRISSPGGSVHEGYAIYNTLKRHKAHKRVHIDGLAGSIASVIAMAGDEINMASNAMMMIHDPMSVAMGYATDLRKRADMLDKIKGTIVDIYVEKTGMDAGKVAEMMASETWMDATEAVSMGFATMQTEEVAIAACFEPTACNFRAIPDTALPFFAKAAPVGRKTTKEPVMAENKEVPATPVVETPVVAATATNATPALTQADIDAARAEAIKAENKRITDITALCETAKLPSMAKEFIADTKITEQDVRNQLFDAMCKTRPAVGDDAAGDVTNAAKVDPDAEFKKEYAENLAYFKNSGTTEESYVASRRKTAEFEASMAG